MGNGHTYISKTGEKKKKQAYDTYMDANAAACHKTLTEGPDERVWQAYKCHICGAYHIGHGRNIVTDKDRCQAWNGLEIYGLITPRLKHYYGIYSRPIYKVQKWSLSGKPLEVYDSPNKASKTMGLRKASVQDAINGHNHSVAYGYRWTRFTFKLRPASKLQLLLASIRDLSENRKYYIRKLKQRIPSYF